MGVVARRFDVLLIRLDPTEGREIKKTLPCLVVSPDEMNRHSSTLIIAPMTTRGPSFPTRVACEFKGKEGQVVLDQIRTIDRSRLLRKLGRVDEETQSKVLSVLQEMFSP
jgi:mRNA interferase MazF